MSGLAMPTAFEGVRTSPNLTLSLNRALEQARDLHQREVTIEHLLLALTDDPDATGSLEACGVDLSRLKTDIATYVTKSAVGGSHAGGGLGDASGEPHAAADLRNMLDQAVDAAREAKRQEINSFIILAAIVGQEKSQAAAILQSHGFTFNEALEALRPRAPRLESASGAAGEGRPAAGQSRQTTSRAADVVPSVSEVAEAMAQSADALPPLPTASARASRPAQPAAPSRSQHKSMDAGPVGAVPQPPPAAAPAANRPPAQSVDDIMASVRDRMGAPRSPAGRAPSPSPVAAQPVAVSRGAPSELPSPASRPATSPTGDARSPLPYSQSGSEEVSANSDVFDLGAPMPEDRIAPPSSAPARPRSGDAAGSRRREPTLGPLPTGAPSPASAQPRRPGMPPPVPAPPLPAPPVPAPQSRMPPEPGLGSAPHPGPNPAPYPGPTAGARQPHAGSTARSPSARPPGPAGPPLATSVAGPTGRRNSLDAVQPGQLAEAIPRIMRAWVAERVEIRIARRSFDGLTVGIEGRGAPARHDIVITSAMSVRLKAPEGGFTIENITPETQWIENRPGLISSDEFANWRWVVRPVRAGRSRLHLVVSARTAGPDGSTAETALPDQIIEIKVRTNYAVAARRWGGWIAAAVIGGMLGRFGEGTFELVRKIAGL